MGRDESKAVIHARALPKFGEVVKAKRGYVRSLGGNVTGIDIYWDLNRQSAEEQVFVLETHVKVKPELDAYGRQRVVAYLPKQALEHFLRAI